MSICLRRRIGVLMPFAENDPVPKPGLSAFTQALADLGWTDGRNVRIDLHWAAGEFNRMRALAQELIGLQPDIILTGAEAVTAAVQRETRTIPIVFAGVTDPVALRIVARLNQPGGNVTGFADFEASLGGNWLELLSEIARAQAGLCRSHPARRKAGRSSGAVSDKIRDGRQPQDRQGAWPCRTPIDPAARRRGDRIEPRPPTDGPNLAWPIASTRPRRHSGAGVNAQG
jgi:hypothetical protein